MASLFEGEILAGACEAYKNVRQIDWNCDVREYLDSAFSDYGHLIPEKDFVWRLQEKFFDPTWELHLIALFSRHSLTLEKPVRHGPDIAIRHLDTRVLIEATNASRGTGANAVPLPPTHGGVIHVKFPDERINLRITQAIHEKRIQYEKWLSKGIVKPNEPFIIAINGGLIPEIHSPYISYAARSVYGISDTGWKVPVRMDGGRSKPEDSEPFAKHTPTFHTAAGSDVTAACFLDEDFRQISGIIFSPHFVANSFNRNGADCELVLNPLAANRLPENFLPFGTVTYVELAPEKGGFLLHSKPR